MTESPQTSSLPQSRPSVVYNDVTYHATGKVGHRVADGVRGAEYANATDRLRIWVYEDGSIIPED